MNQSILDSAIKTLEQSLNSLNGWLEFWTALVVVGLIVEYAENLWKLVTERPFNMKLFRELIGGLLITAGVVGELGVGFKASKVETNLRNANHSVEALLDTEAKQAEERAKTAEQKTEEERGERIKLEAAVAPRSLSLDQQRLIKVALGSFSRHPPVTVSSYGLDGEAAAVGGQIIAIIGSATGIVPLDRRASFISTGGFEMGIQIRGPNSEQEFMSTLATALTSIGKMKEVHVNGPSFKPGAAIGGGAAFGGAASIGGGGRGIVPASVPATGPVTIMVGVKPLPVLPAK